MAILKWVWCFGSFLLLFAISDGAVTSPLDQEACVGDSVTIPWEYDDADNDISSVIWSVNTSTDVMTYFGTGSTRDPENGYNVVASNNNGSITITSATRSNSGKYRIDITAAQTTSDEVEVLICEPSETGLKVTKSGSELKCEASNLGDPEAELYIKVNGENKTSSSAEVTIFDVVECCLKGCAVQCMSAEIEYCKEVQIFPWWIILLIVVGSLYAIGLGIGIIKWILQHKHKKLCEEFCEKCCDVPGKKDDVLKWCFFIFLCAIIVGLGLMTVWLIRRCFGGGDGDVEPRVDKPRHETQSGNQRTDQKKPDTKKNKSTDSVVHIENEQHNQGRKHREQPLLPPHGAGAATGTTLNDRPMPDIPRANDRPGHDSKGRGLSANFSDDYHPLASIDTPSQKAGALGSLPEGSSGGEVPVKKLKKRKKKSKGDQED